LFLNVSNVVFHRIFLFNFPPTAKLNKKNQLKKQKSNYLP